MPTGELISYLGADASGDAIGELLGSGARTVDCVLSTRGGAADITTILELSLIDPTGPPPRLRLLCSPKAVNSCIPLLAHGLASSEIRVGSWTLPDLILLDGTAAYVQAPVIDGDSLLVRCPPCSRAVRGILRRCVGPFAVMVDFQ